MNVVDSSGWLEYLADETNADFFAPAIERPSDLIVPSITIYEVFKRVRQQRGEHLALQSVALMLRGRVIDLDTTLALAAAGLSAQHALPLADSVILATARNFDARLWTQDEHFQGLDGIRFIAKPQRSA